MDAHDLLRVLAPTYIPDKIEHASFSDLHFKRAHLVILEPLRNATQGVPEARRERL